MPDAVSVRKYLYMEREQHGINGGVTKVMKKPGGNKIMK